MDLKHPVLVSVFLVRKTKAFRIDAVTSFNPSLAFAPHGGAGILLPNIYDFLRMEIVLKCQNFQWDIPCLTVPLGWDLLLTTESPTSCCYYHKALLTPGVLPQLWHPRAAQEE